MVVASMLSHGASQTLPKSHIEAVLSVPPLKVTEPRRVRHVSVRNTNSNNIGGCYNIVLYYEKLREEEHGLFLVGWIVESLARVLLDYPLLAGRIQKKVENGDNMGFEIVTNDSGVRFYEARFPMNLSEYLGLSGKESFEGELVFWKEIDEQNPEFSPLFYIQVTKFECGGYSIGISCSLLLEDVMVIENFLKNWAEIHNHMIPQNENIKTPIFCHPLLKNEDSPPVDVISRTPCQNGAHTMPFKITAQGINFNMELWRELAINCLDEAEQKLQQKLGSDFSLFVKESSKIIKVEGCSSKSGYSKEVLGLKNGIIQATWNDFGVCGVAFHEGNKPIHVSHSIGSVGDGHVIAVQYPKENVSAVIIVSLHIEK
ncbi:hypothetical protein TanjilG_21086 [Lupinus angustifolius]|uniref:Uncharacterized protein n=1 Tax=Lupinus angustifolius TaxID=3871 RepID=A0A1J7FZC9_LUPAN|nr:PREDICTED: 2-alpha-hydroxytaxane 2-O-benzoyltransferase-like [Lupinus angustifolius]OIV93375.1 hypothetical protein TanjilG_21086 [Lupinus angustifolius]